VNALTRSVIDWGAAVYRQWDRFWFAPQPPHTLALVRILGGAMLLYTHAVWSLDLTAFLGPSSWLTPATAGLLSQPPGGQSYAWSYLYYVESPALLWPLHIGALAVFAMLTVGWYTRVVSVLAFVITLAYCHRLTGALFGLDQVNVLIATYLMLGPAGAVWSVDRWRAARRGRVQPPRPSVGANIAIRLMQLHMCVIYLFGGIGKMQGELWWNGSALWYALSLKDYQSLDMTWTVHFPAVLALLTHITLFWEVFYPVLIWPKLTRPVFLTMAVLVHLGIGMCMGMWTFGLAMIIGNLAFVYPQQVEAAVGWLIAATGRGPKENAAATGKGAIRRPHSADAPSAA
jgi:hypothetical protein